MQRHPKPKVVGEESVGEVYPLSKGESRHPSGSNRLFREHDFICLDDYLGGHFNEQIFVTPNNRGGVENLFWGRGLLTFFHQDTCYSNCPP